jgi:hypothetical protein
MFASAKRPFFLRRPDLLKITKEGKLWVDIDKRMRLGVFRLGELNGFE